MPLAPTPTSRPGASARHRARRARQAAAALVLWAACGPLQAAEIVVVGVHDGDLDATAQAEIVSAVAAAVELSGRHDALTGAALARRLAGREELTLRDAFLADGRRLLEDGRILYQQAQPEDAQFVLEGATRTLADGVLRARSTRELWDAWMLLGTARAGLGDETGARDALATAVALNPDRRPDPAAYPPDVVRLWQSEREVLDGEAVTLEVSAGEVTGRLWLDGREVGALPGAISALPGQHHLHARTDDGRLGALRVEVTAVGGGPVELPLFAPTLTPPGAKAATERAGRIAETASLYRALGRYADADLVLLLGRVDGAPVVAAYAPDIDTFTAPVEVSALGEAGDYVAGVADILATLDAEGRPPTSGKVYTAPALDVGTNPVLAGALLAPPAQPAPVSPLPAEPPPAPKRWPLWVGVGVGSAALVATAVALGVAFGGGGGEPEPGTGTIVVGPAARR